MTLYNHQEEAANFIIQNGGSGAIYHEVGLGKTRTALSIFGRLRQGRNQSNCPAIPALTAVVVAPIALLEAAWGADIKRFAPDLTYCNLRKEEKPADIYLVNYEMLLSAKKIQAIIAIARKNPCVIILDESSKMKNPSAKITKTLLNIRHLFQYRIVMSGTPAPNLETEYWAQMRFVTPERHPHALPESFFAFRNQYFHLERGRQKMQGIILTSRNARELFGKGWKYSISAENKNRLFSIIEKHIHHAKKKDCLDLPEQIDQIRHITLGEHQAKIYKDMKNYCIAEIQNEAIPAQVALTKLMKLRQITSGFALTPEGDVVRTPENPKLAELQAVLEEIGNEQVIIWGHFHHEIETIAETLGEKATCLYGETKDKDAVIQDFLAGRKQYLVAHPRSAGHGLTFVNAAYQIFYSMDYSYELYEQCRGRTHRAGQKRTCVYVHLIAPTTIDEEILDVVRRKKDALELVYQWR